MTLNKSRRPVEKRAVSITVCLFLFASTEELPEEQIKSKKSELRLYCDLLMQQVHSVKSAINNKDGPNVQELNEATSLLTATCDTFIGTLDECVTLSHANVTQAPPSPSRKSPSNRVRISKFGEKFLKYEKGNV